MVFILKKQQIKKLENEMKKILLLGIMVVMTQLSNADVDKDKLNRIGNASQIQTSCDLTVKIECYEKNSTCQKIGSDRYYDTCVSLSNIDTGDSPRGSEIDKHLGNDINKTTKKEEIKSNQNHKQTEEVCSENTQNIQPKKSNKPMTEKDRVMETYNIEGKIQGASSAFVMLAINEFFSGDIKKSKHEKSKIYEYIQKECIQLACELKATYSDRNLYDSSKSKCIGYAEGSLKQQYGI
jgi:hypothetical protein